MLTSKQRHYLEDIWTNPKYSAAFSGPYKLYTYVKKHGKFKISFNAIQQFLSDNDAYSLHKRVRRKFKRTHVIVEGKDSQWDGDLMDTKNIAKYNQGYQYVLVLQDVFSRYIFTVPVRNKKASVVVTALKSVVEKSSRKPEILRTDKGSEFKNKQMASFLNEQGIHQIFTQNETKSNFAERAIQNLRAKMSRMFSQKNSFKYLKELQDITNGINNTPNRSLGNIEPSSVNKSNEDEVRLNAYLVRSNTKLKSVKNTRKKPHSTTRKMYKRPIISLKSMIELG